MVIGWEKQSPKVIFIFLHMVKIYRKYCIFIKKIHNFLCYIGKEKYKYNLYIFKKRFNGYFNLAWKNKYFIFHKNTKTIFFTVVFWRLNRNYNEIMSLLYFFKPFNLDLPLEYSF